MSEMLEKDEFYSKWVPPLSLFFIFQINSVQPKLVLTLVVDIWNQPNQSDLNSDLIPKLKTFLTPPLSLLLPLKKIVQKKLLKPFNSTSSWNPKEDLRDYFTKYGGIESLTLKTDPTTGRSRGFAFIVFTDGVTLDKVIHPVLVSCSASNSFDQ
jgi:hypothetical protein